MADTRIVAQLAGSVASAALPAPLKDTVEFLVALDTALSEHDKAVKDWLDENDHAWDAAMLLTGSFGSLIEQDDDNDDDGVSESAVRIDARDSRLKAIDLATCILGRIGSACGSPRDLVLYACDHLAALVGSGWNSPEWQVRIAQFLAMGWLLVSAIGRVQPQRRTSMLQDAAKSLHSGLSLFRFVKALDESASKAVWVQAESAYIRMLDSLYASTSQDGVSTTEVERLACGMAEHIFGSFDNSVVLSDPSLHHTRQFLTLGRKLGLGVGPGWTGAAATHQSLGAAIITALPFSPALADQMPLVYHPEWLFDKVMDAMLVLFSQRRVHLAITMLDFLLPRLAPMSIGLSTFGEEVQGVSDNEPAHETGHQQLVKAMLSAILTASSQQQSTVAFCAFKALLQIYTDDVKSRILLGILVDSKAPAMIVAGISLLKDAIHLALQDNGGREAKTASLFGTHVARDTFLSILLDGRSALYRNEVVFKGSSIFDSEPLLFERHSVLMHSLNLYQYLLLRQTPDTDRLGVWDSMHINATSQKLLAPLEKAVSRAITGLEDKQKPNAAPGDENADDLLRQLMDMRVLENVLHHVQGITRRLS